MGLTGKGASHYSQHSKEETKCMVNVWVHPKHLNEI